jgi:hypothetical protein
MAALYPDGETPGREASVQLSELFHRQTWTLVGIAARRVHIDARARKLLSATLVWLLVLVLAPIVGVLLLVVAIALPQNFTPIGLFIGLSVGLGIRFFRRQAQLERLLEKAAADVPLSVRTTIFRVTYWLAILIRRCESEFALLKVMPPEMEVITRRVLLERLRKEGVWEEMPLQVRDLLLKPDGHWSEEERNLVAEKFEYLACLRWITKKDSALRLLALPPNYKYPHALEIATDPAWFRSDLTLAPMRVETHAKLSAGFLERCTVECITRGMFAADEENRARAAKRKTEIDRAGRGADWLFGSKTIGETSDMELRKAQRRAFLRFRLLRAVLEDMAGKDPTGRIQALLEESFLVQAVQIE